MSVDLQRARPKVGDPHRRSTTRHTGQEDPSHDPRKHFAIPSPPGGIVRLISMADCAVYPLPRPLLLHKNQTFSELSCGRLRS